jgi:hypothetical protein
LSRKPKKIKNTLTKKAHGVFNTTADALRLLGCKRKDYYEGEKNVWFVEMPEFVSHIAIKNNSLKNKTLTEIDDEFHDKFRHSETKVDIQKDH